MLAKSFFVKHQFAVHQHTLEPSLLDPEQKELITGIATECAQLFQRSSSCTEGRNGQLALRHHSLHRLSHRKLNVLTTVHNYFITRPDGSTAAQRFFNADPRSLFDYLLAHVDLPGRPAQKRPPPPPPPPLLQSGRNPFGRNDDQSPSQYSGVYGHDISCPYTPEY